MSDVALRVRDGADLVTRLSEDEAGLANFVVLRDWRIELDKIVRREGDSLFVQGEAANLIFTARKDNGKTALIVGTQTKLLRYYALEDPDYLVDGYFEADYFAAIGDGTWLQIGSGFSNAGHRWEAHNVGGVAVFNNGVDLPVTYDLYELAVRPIYELREQGIAFVDTIMELAGVLVCMNNALIDADYLPTVMNAVGYGGFAIGQENHCDRVHYDLIWSDPKGAGRWGASQPGAIAAGTRTLVVGYDMASIQPGDAVRVVGAGADGGDLLTTLAYKAGPTTWILADEAETDTITGTVARQDAASLITGRYALLDDSSPILRGIKTQDDQAIIAKSTGFILGTFTGNPAAPFSFVRIFTGEGALYWRWTLLEVGGVLLYAGESEFYAFDLVTRRPQIHSVLALCANVFFDAVAAADQNEVFACDNGLTKEAWFVFPGSGADKALAYSYLPRELGGGRCATIGAAYTAAATVDLPTASVDHDAAERRFFMGTATGKVLQYGRTRAGATLWQRQGASYSSELRSGAADFGSEVKEKHVKNYLLLLASQSPNNAVTVSLYAERNPGEGMALQSTKALASPRTANIVPVHHQAHLFQDGIVAAGSGNVQISKRVWQGDGMGGGSMDRR